MSDEKAMKMPYDVAAYFLRQQADIKMPEGFVHYGGDTDPAILPRWTLNYAVAESQNGNNGPRDMCLADLWGAGMEMALAKEVQDVDNYELELIGGYPDGGYSGDPVELESTIGSGKTIALVEWPKSYLLRAYGLHSMIVERVHAWPDGRALYAVSLYEGEGWWGVLYFGLKN